jgi:hypothetical protein
MGLELIWVDEVMRAALSYVERLWKSILRWFGLWLGKRSIWGELLSHVGDCHSVGSSWQGIYSAYPSGKRGTNYRLEAVANGASTAYVPMILTFPKFLPDIATTAMCKPKRNRCERLLYTERRIRAEWSTLGSIIKR